MPDDRVGLRVDGVGGANMRGYRGFNIFHNKGFHMTFANGLTVSVQFGAGNYCEHYHDDVGCEQICEHWESKDAEVAVWDRHGNWITRQFYDQDIGDDVLGGQSTDEVAKLIGKVSAYRLTN